jgi:uncharacterized protein (TIGR02266 family)
MPASHRSSKENRAHRRLHVEIEVTLVSESQFYAGLSNNLSEGGVFVATYVTRKIGEKLDLTLTLPDAKPIRTVGEVRWVRGVSDRIDLPAGIGLRFVTLSEEDAKAIVAFLRKRQPLFFED